MYSFLIDYYSLQVVVLIEILMRCIMIYHRHQNSDEFKLITLFTHRYITKPLNNVISYRSGVISLSLSFVLFSSHVKTIRLDVTSRLKLIALKNWSRVTFVTTKNTHLVFQTIYPLGIVSYIDVIIIYYYISDVTCGRYLCTYLCIKYFKLLRIVKVDL